MLSCTNSTVVETGPTGLIGRLSDRQVPGRMARDLSHHWETFTVTDAVLRFAG